MKARRMTTLIAVLSAAAAIIAGAAVLAGAAGGGAASAPSPTATDLAGNVVALDPGITSPAGSDAIEDTGERFRIPSVDLDVSLGAVSEVDDQITPPGFGSVYVVRNRGVSLNDAEQGTVYAVTHSLRGGGKAPGNALIDVRNKKAAVEIGARIEIGDRIYEVTETLRVTKEELPKTSDLWADTPERLVLITCLQNSEGKPSTDNLITVAQLVR